MNFYNRIRKLEKLLKLIQPKQKVVFLPKEDTSKINQALEQRCKVITFSVISEQREKEIRAMYGV